MKLVLVGLTVGCLAALGVARFIASRLYGITATDPLVLCSASALLALIALLAFPPAGQRWSIQWRR